MRRMSVWRGAIVALMLFSGVAFAVTSPTAMMQGVANKMINYLQAHKYKLNKPGVISFIVNKALVPHVDMSRMGAAVVGRRYWMAASPSQRRQFVKEFKRMVIRTYSNALSSYDGDKITVYPLRGSYTSRRVIRVRSLIVRRSGQRIPISYNLLRSGNTWKIYDFSIENVSMVNSYRSQFAGTLARGGMKGLLRRLSSHNRR